MGLKSRQSDEDLEASKAAATACAVEMGKRAALQRTLQNRSIKEIADAMGRTYACVFGMEQIGTTNLRVILDWSKALGCTPAWLAFGAGGQAANIIILKDLLRDAMKAIDGRYGFRKKLVASIKEELER